MLSQSTPVAPVAPGDQLLRRREVEDEVKLSRATLHRKIGAGLFPPAIDYGPQLKRWPSSWIEAWKKLGPDWRQGLPAPPP